MSCLSYRHLDVSKMSVKIILAIILMLATNSENNSTKFIEDRIILISKQVTTPTVSNNVQNLLGWSKNYHQDEFVDLVQSYHNATAGKYRRDSDEASLDVEVNWNDILNNEKLVKEILKRLQTYPTISTSSTPYLPYTTSPKPSKHGHSKKHYKRRRVALEIALTGTTDQLRKISRRRVLEILENKEMISLSLQKKLILWEIFKNNKRVVELGVHDLRLFGDLLLEIPENDFYKINVTNLEILKYLGTMEHMTRRKAGVIAYAIKNRSNSSFTTNTTFINNVKGLICGLPSRRLKQINPKLIEKIQPEVFMNLWACNQQQLNALLEVCTKNIIYKNLETWSNNTIKYLGFLITALRPEDIKKLEPDILNSLEGKTLARFDREQIAAFTQTQIRNFNPETRAVYYNFLLVESSSRHICDFYILILCLALFYGLNEIFLYY